MRVNRKTKIAIIIPIVFVALLALYLFGYNIYYHSYDLRKYSAFFKYSLGEYEVISKQIIKQGRGAGPNGTKWLLRYQHQNGEEMTFSIFRGDLWNNELGYDVLDNATKNMADYVENEIVAKYFPVFSIYEVLRFDDSSEAMYVSLDWNKQLWLKNNEGGGYTHVLDTQNGLRLYSVTPQELVSDWSCDFIITVVARDRLNAYEDYHALFQSLEPMVRDLHTYLGQDQFEIWLHSDSMDDCFVGFYTYNSSADTFDQSFDWD